MNNQDELKEYRRLVQDYIEWREFLERQPFDQEEAKKILAAVNEDGHVVDRPRYLIICNHSPYCYPHFDAWKEAG